MADLTKRELNSFFLSFSAQRRVRGWLKCRVCWIQQERKKGGEKSHGRV